ncbi:hypothetical protein F7725_014915 [Dissostichus mawsoni]|uniref:Exportin 7 n=1 Tax=Dissostichus mawsoni TaxID=36200 RepID=A0A7J5YJF8_DISMA|nr:hypothetical protein F7725_014915 [Dissostichus mawsoni]
MIHQNGLAQLEILCKQLYETTDSAVRLQAEKALVEFTNSPDCLSKCQLLLERGSSSYSQLLAATCFLNWFLEPATLSRSSSASTSRTLGQRTLGQRLGQKEVRTEEVRTGVRTEDVRTEEVRTEEVRTEELGQKEVRTEDVRTEEVRTEGGQKVRTEEVRTEEFQDRRRLGQRRLGQKEFRTEEVRLKRLGQKEVRTEEVRTEEVRTEEVRTEEVRTEGGQRRLGQRSSGQKEVRTEEFRTEEVRTEEVRKEGGQRTLGQRRLGQKEVRTEEVRTEEVRTEGGLGQRRLGQRRLGQRRLGQKRLGQRRLGQRKLGQRRLGQKRLGQKEVRREGGWTEEVRTEEVRTEEVRTEEVRTEGGQRRLGQRRLGQRTLGQKEVRTEEVRTEGGNYVLNYLATRPKLAAFVTQALIQLYARITKLGWFDCQKEDYVFRNVIADVTRFLQDSVEHCIIGVTILSQLTNEINQADTTHPLTKHRKIASSFRDSSLFDIFTLSCNLLKQLLKLSYNCLNYDFIGTSTDESSDDLCTVQIPTSWRSAFLDSSTLQLFFNLYHSIPPSLSPLVLSCLVQIASVRRSLFNNAERAKFLSHLVDGVKRILVNPQCLPDPNNYHEFCRLLARLKSNYQLGELVKVENYPEVIRLIANFTVTSLQHWEFAPNSVHYLLSLWQRLAASVPYVKATEPHLLETYTPEVTKAYITSRLESVHVILRWAGGPSGRRGARAAAARPAVHHRRCEYEKTCALLVQLFDQAAQSYQELLQSTNSSAADITVQEGRLTWLVYIIGAVIGGRVSFASTDEQDAMDGELVCRVLQLMNLTDSRLAQAGNERLELAMLSFFEQFRKIYIGDQVQKSSKLYRRLSEVLGLNDETMVLSVFIGKIITNLKYWGQCEPITSKTLQLLNDLSLGYPSADSVRKLVKLSADEDQFEQFMLPLTAAFETVAQMLSTNTFNEQEAKRTLVGLVRDLRGIAFAFNAKTSFMMLFDWMYPHSIQGFILMSSAAAVYPAYMPILQRAIELWYHDPACTTPVSEATVRRVVAERHPAVRETSKMITTYGNRILTLGEVPKDQVYGVKLKGVSVCFAMLKAVLSGNYVNFGVFRLYGDDALDNALQTFIKLLLSIPHSDCSPPPSLQDYPKLSQSFYSLLEIRWCVRAAAPVWITSSRISSSSSRAPPKRPTPMATDDRFLHIMQQHPEMIQQMLSTVFEHHHLRGLQEPVVHVPPLLGLILLNEKNLSVFRREVNDSMKNSTYGVNSNDMMS